MESASVMNPAVVATQIASISAHRRRTVVLPIHLVSLIPFSVTAHMSAGAVSALAKKTIKRLM